jgi:hypothetical protein
MFNLFELNDNLDIKTEIFDNSKIYIIDDFYKYPDEIAAHLFIDVPAKLWKAEDRPSFNGEHFIDQRHDFKDTGVVDAEKLLSNLCGQPISSSEKIVTNCIQLFNKEFNDYKNNYWCPHTDYGYNGIVYLNTFDFLGTNLYEQIDRDINNTPEHYAPWRSRSKYRVIKTLEAKFNRLVLFDGAHFIHGMSIEDDTFFNLKRINQVFFFN